MGIGAGGWPVVRWRGMVCVGRIVGCWWSGGFGLCVDDSDDAPCWRAVGRMDLGAAARRWLGCGGIDGWCQAGWCV